MLLTSAGRGPRQSASVGRASSSSSSHKTRDAAITDAIDVWLGRLSVRRKWPQVKFWGWFGGFCQISRALPLRINNGCRLSRISVHRQQQHACKDYKVGNVFFSPASSSSLSLSLSLSVMRCVCVCVCVCARARACVCEETRGGGGGGGRKNYRTATYRKCAVDGGGEVREEHELTPFVNFQSQMICFTLKLIRAKKGITRTYVTHSSLNRRAQCMAACSAV